ncbi:MAG: adenylosuccinate synthetase [Candidatus Heimdallarchaeota archaeon]|nr:adenylosuccinate synthetase [Candidatus Heimdallarchaeota archaeon]
MLTVVVGGQYGDEGKGKITSYLANQGVDAVVRAGTGPNAGHTVVHEGVTYKLRIIPSGFVHKEAQLFIGAGMLITESILHDEIEKTGIKDRIFIDRNTGVITPDHIESEKANNYLMGTVGSTGSGCGTANVDRVNRKLKLARDYPSFKNYITDVSEAVNTILDNNGTVIVEGSQATFLSLYHGYYPYVTSKDVCASATLSDIGIGPTRCDEVIVVLKSYTTRVGEGELEGELSAEEIEKRGWQEFGTVTGRLRRAAPFNFELAKKAVRINGATEIALTKLDILYPNMKGKTNYNDLEEEAKEFINKIEDYTGVPVKYISTGPGSTELIIAK